MLLRPALSCLTLLALAGCGPKGEAVDRLVGTLTWTLDFDPAAEARGLEDCTYSRSYDGTTDQSVPWLCPDCDAVFRVDSRLKGRDCYDQISEGAEPSETEWLGFSGQGFRRASTENFVLAELGRAESDGHARSVKAEVEPREIVGGGSFALQVEGALRVRPGRGDPMWGLSPPEQPACGWDRADPPAYTGDWTLREGEPIPDGWFEDACQEGVRLYDQLDRYLVIEVSAVDCPPCQDMGEGEEPFLASARAQGLDVAVVTLLAPSLGGVLDPTSTRDLEEWTRAFDLSMPVLADRGWGFWLGLDALGDSMGYPAVLIVAPDGTLLELETGFAGWDRILDRIALDASGVGR